jgi:hypothetical protein
MPTRKRLPRTTQSLPRTIFRKQTELILKQLVDRLAPYLKKEKVADLALEYLKLGEKMVRVPVGNRTYKFRAITIAENFNPPFSGPNFEVIDQPDFEKSAAILLTNEDFSVLKPSISEIRVQARALELPWDTARSILQEAIGRLCADKRPKGVQRGEFRAEVLRELELVRSSGRRFRDFDELKEAFPNFKIVDIIGGPLFKQDEREYLISPSQWETKTTTYCNGILKKYWGLESEETVKGYRKDYNRVIDRHARR